MNWKPAEYIMPMNFLQKVSSCGSQSSRLSNLNLENRKIKCIFPRDSRKLCKKVYYNVWMGADMSISSESMSIFSFFTRMSSTTNLTKLGISRMSFDKVIIVFNQVSF